MPFGAGLFIVVSYTTNVSPAIRIPTSEGFIITRSNSSWLELVSLILQLITWDLKGKTRRVMNVFLQENADIQKYN